MGAEKAPPFSLPFVSILVFLDLVFEGRLIGATTLVSFVSILVFVELVLDGDLSRMRSGWRYAVSILVFVELVLDDHFRPAHHAKLYVSILVFVELVLDDHKCLRTLW